MNRIRPLFILMVLIAFGLITLPAFAQTAKTTFADLTPNAVPVLGVASRYPATIAVSGLANVYHVSVTLNVTHTFPSDLDVLLVGPSGATVMLMRGNGSGADLANRVFSLDDCAARGLFSASPAAGNRYRPTNSLSGTSMPAPAPAAPYRNELAAFNWAIANGTWSLYVNDRVNGDSGSTNSWRLTFYTTSTPASITTGGGNPVSCSAPDYDGDGRTDIAVYRENTGDWFISQSGQSGAAMFVSWGAPALNDIQAPADFDGDGITDVAVYRRTSGEWFIRRSSDLGTMQVPFGAGSASGLGDTPVPGDYDGDGQADQAIYRTTTGQWFVRTSTGQGVQTQQWGFPPLSDVPARR